jgi:uncharacterized damage-inducible protein DinB
MRTNFLNLFEYNDWANERVLESFKTIEKIDEKAQLLFSHILISQTIWLERILGKAQTFKTTMQLLSIDECTKLSKQSTKDWISFVENLDEQNLTSVINYKNTKGVEYENHLSDIVTHVINHSSYHRGQIALLVRNSGGIPAVTDYIAYSR